MSKLDLNGKIALVSGANRGLGKAIVEQLIEKGVAKIYAGSRKKKNLDELVTKYGDKIVPIELDVTSQKSVDRATKKIDHIDLLVNNAGIFQLGAILSDDAQTTLQGNLDVNVWGTVRLSNALSKHFVNNNPAAIVNISSISALGNMPIAATYSVSKAAIHSLTQGMRAELAPKNTLVVGVYPGTMDTDMTAGWDLEKADTTLVAKNVLDAIENGTEDVFPDAQSEQIGGLYQTSPKTVEQTFASMGQ